MKKFIIASLLLSIASVAFANESTELYTGNAQGTYYSVGQELCKALGCVVKTSNGSIENIEELTNNHDNQRLAIVQSDILHEAYYGLGVFSKSPSKHVLPLCTLYEEAFTVVVRADSKINYFSDLKNKIVNVGKTNSGNYHATKKLLELYDMSLTDFKHTSYLPMETQGEALCRGTIDAAIYAVGHPNQNIYNITQNCDIKIISVFNDATKKLTAEYPYYVETIIKANTYPNVTQDIETIGVLATLVASENLSSSYVFNLLKLINTPNRKLKLIHPALHDINIDTNIPLHPGAAEFYKVN